MAPTCCLIIWAWLMLALRVHRALASCEPAACGNLTVRHPFWLSTPGGPPPAASVSCGPPSFEVSCSSNGSVASLKDSSIHVHSIDYGSSTFVVSHNRVADGVCRADFNVSFRISRSNRALCFLYSCNGTEPRGDEYVNATSSCGRFILAYLGGSYDRDRPPPIPAGKCTYTYLPVLGSAAVDMTNAANYSLLLKAGFLLEWSGGAAIGDCAGCEASGGQCRYSNDSVAFACLCPGGVIRGSTCMRW